MHQVSVSVLMCVYNEESRYLRESIDSILHQTYQDFEFIIICDNPNNERIILLLEEYANNDNRIKIHTNDVNIGLTKSLNIGLKLCKGDFIARIDADDVALPNRLDKQVAYMESHEDVMACGSYAIAINEEGREIRLIKVPSNQLAIKGGVLFASPLLHPAAMIRNHAGLSYDESFRYSQDYALWVKYLSQGQKLANLKETLMKYRYSSNQIFNKHHEEQQVCASRIKSEAIRMLGLNDGTDDLSMIYKLSNNNATIDSSYEEIVKCIYNTFKYSFNNDKKVTSYVCYRFLLNSLSELLMRSNYFSLLWVSFKLLLSTGSWQLNRYFVVAYYALSHSNKTHKV